MTRQLAKLAVVNHGDQRVLVLQNGDVLRRLDIDQQQVGWFALFGLVGSC